MVFKSIQKIKETLPETMHIVMFYDDGTVLQTTFQEPVNIRDIGATLASNLKNMDEVFKLSKINKEDYIKLIYETENYLVLIHKLGEQSNLALFFLKGEEFPKISAIRRYLYRIEYLMDTDKLSLAKRQIEEMKKDLAQLEQDFHGKLELIEKKKLNIADLDKKIFAIEKEINEKEVYLKSEDFARLKLEGYIERKEEHLEVCDESEEKEIKHEIKEDKKSLSAVDKSLKKGEKEIGKLDSRIEKLENEKAGILSEINAIIDERQKLKEKIEQKTIEITTLKEKIAAQEKARIEKELFMEKELFYGK